MAYLGVSPSNGVRKVHTYTATASQTTFSGAGAENISLSYRDSTYIDVYQNGVKLGDADYTATSGTSVVLGTGASADDIVVVVVYDVFSVADTVSKTDGGQFDGNVTMAGTITVTGNADLNGDLDVDGTANLDVVDVDGTVNFAADVTFADGADIITASAGTSNFRAGVNAGNSITSGGNYNVVVGDEAGTALTTGDNNVAVGFEALATEDGNGNNVGVGYRALKTQNAGADGYNVAIGSDAGTALTTGVYNTIVGGLAGDALTVGNHNVAVGLNALTADTKGEKSVAIGYQALLTQNFTSATDTGNVAIGFEAGKLLTTGTHNTLLGYQAGDALTTPFGNVALGDRTLSSETTGQRNTAVGCTALFSQNGASETLTYNTAFGYQAGGSITTGIENVFIGALAGDACTDDDHNTFVGYNSGAIVNGGFRNTFLGKDSGDAMTTGDKNVIIGSYSGNEGSLDIRTESGHIILSEGDGNVRLRISGGSNVDQLFVPGVYTWTTSSSANVVVTSSAGHIARSTSALKYKQDIRDLEDIDIDKFRPIRYKSKSDIDDQTKDHFGFIADEVHDAGITELVSYGDDNEVEGFQYERMTAVLVKTLQEQKKTIASLEARIKILEEA